MNHRKLPRQKRNIIWKLKKADLEFAIKSASTFADILRHFNFATSSRNYKVLQSKLDSEDIDWSHLPTGLGTNKGKIYGPRPLIPTSFILVKGSTFSRVSLKKRLLREGLLRNECYNCFLPPEWNGQPLKLQIDHVNGIHNDNRLENLRILCPNCHSQTETFAGKNTKKK